MNKTYFFLSGLPRSGSTLLRSILNQNPKIYCSPISPVFELMCRNKLWMENCDQTKSFYRPNQEKNIISNIINLYYEDYSNEYIIDNCRSWTTGTDLIKEYITHKPKIICPVRNVSEILTSFILLTQKNKNTSFIDKFLNDKNIPITNDNRCDFLMSDYGVVHKSLVSLSQSPKKYVYLVEYDDLVNQPHQTMKKIYSFLEINYFKHDFNNIENLLQENDFETWGIEDMHKVRSVLKKNSPNPKEVLSEYILNKYKNLEFWRKKERMFLL